MCHVVGDECAQPTSEGEGEGGSSTINARGTAKWTLGGPIKFQLISFYNEMKYYFFFWKIIRQ